MSEARTKQQKKNENRQHFWNAWALNRIGIESNGLDHRCHLKSTAHIFKTAIKYKTFSMGIKRIWIQCIFVVFFFNFL